MRNALLPIINTKRSTIPSSLKPYVVNGDIGLRKWRAALAGVKSSGIINLPIIHDSIGEGCHVAADPTGKKAEYIAYSWIGLLQTKFISNLGFDNVGNGLITNMMVNYDRFWTYAGTGWDLAYTRGTMGYGKKWSGTADGNQTATVAFNGTGVSIIYTKRVTHAHFTYAIDGGEAVDVDPYNGSEIYNFETVVTGLDAGDHTLVITKAAGDSLDLYITGIYEIKGSRGVRVNRCGVYGTAIAKAVVSAAAQHAEIDFWNPPLTIIAMTANDYSDQTALATYSTHVQTLITRAKTFGDVMLLSYCPQGGAAKAIPMTDYNNVLRGLAVTNNCCFVDLISKWGSYDAANAAGLMNDTVHPNAAGHQAIANDVWAVLGK